MGRLLLVWRLAVRDLRHRPAQALLLLLAIAVGAATLTLGLALRGTTTDPYARTRAATNGPDVVAAALPGGDSGPTSTARPGDGGGPASDQADTSGLVPLEHAAGVVAHSGPFPVTWTTLQSGQIAGSAEVEGRSLADSAVDQPKLLQGSWVAPGGVVVEAGFASAFGLHVGDDLKLGGQAFRVVGTAASAAVATYPQSCSSVGCFLVGQVGSYNPGVVWTTAADVQRLAGPVGYFLNLKLGDPTAAAAFVHRYDGDTSPAVPQLRSWQDISDADALEISKVQLVLVTGSWLMALLAVASVAVLVGGRMAEQTRRVGLLKAVGGTPVLVAVVVLFENALIAVGAAAVGLLTGWLAAPLVDSPGAGLLGAPSAPPLTGSTVVLVLALALGVAVVATFVPALRAAGQSTVGALEDSARPPRRSALLVRLSTHLPPALLLGARLAGRRPRRLLLSVFSIAVAASGLVAVLILRASATGWSVGPRETQATAVISVLLVVLAAVNAVFIAWTTVLETRHPAALARALGATPTQVTTGLTVAYLVSTLVGALLGIPGGIAVYDVAKRGGSTTVPSGLWLTALVVLALVVIAVLTAIPTHIGTRRPVADVLQAEST